MADYDIGLVGLGVMGSNLLLNMADQGFSVAGFDTDTAKADTLRKAGNGRKIFVAASLTEMVSQLRPPRIVMVMVPAGRPVDEVVAGLGGLLERGDILVDGGNSNFQDTIRRVKEADARGLLFVGMGVSGGEEGARHGPSLMPGGAPAAWPRVKPIFQAIAAKVEGMPCCDWVGEGGAGHFVKMVHNGIEYGDMQLIGEAYALMQAAGMKPRDMHEVFARWNEGELNSYLIEITADILGRRDPLTRKPMVDVILDAAGQKGTGKWTVITAADLGVPVTLIAEAVFARCISAAKDERVEASKILAGPPRKRIGSRQAFVEDIRHALYASKICSYAQGFQLMRAAGKEYGWNINYGGIAQMWRGGCIIRSQFLGRIKEAYTADAGLVNLLLASYFRDAVTSAQPAWRRTVARAVEMGVPAPAFSSALAYFDGYRSERLPANLLQAQRDYFGAHQYERVDRPRGQFFHTHWTEAG